MWSPLLCPVLSQVVTRVYYHLEVAKLVIKTIYLICLKAYFNLSVSFLTFYTFSIKKLTTNEVGGKLRCVCVVGLC